MYAPDSFFLGRDNILVKLMVYDLKISSTLSKLPGVSLLVEKAIKQRLCCCR